MVDAWPESLPQCFNIGFGEGVGDGLLSTSPDTGPPMTRGRFSAVTYPLSGQMRMTSVQIAALKTFFYTALIRGALPFEFPDPHDHDEKLLVRFPKETLPSWQQIAPGNFRVQINLMVLP